MAYAVTKRANGMHEMAAASDVHVWWEGGNDKCQRFEDGDSLQVRLQKSGMDWKVQRAEVQYATARGNQNIRRVPDRHVLFRSDTGDAVGHVSNSFKVVQPSETMEFFEDLIHHLGWKLQTAGTLHGGSKFWAQAEIARDSVTPGTLNKASLLLATAVDGSMNTLAKNVNTETVCANTLAMALGEHGDTVKVSHRSVFDAEKVKRQLGVAVDSYHKFLLQARSLSKLTLSPAESKIFLAQCMGMDFADVNGNDIRAFVLGKDVKLGEKNDRIANSTGLAKVLNLFAIGRGQELPGRKNTLWGAVNAMTDYVDHEIRAHSAENRFDSSQFGMGDRLKTDAWKRAIEAAALA